MKKNKHGKKGFALIINNYKYFYFVQSFNNKITGRLVDSINTQEFLIKTVAF